MFNLVFNHFNSLHRIMSAIADSVIATATATVPKYTTHLTRSWHQYQSVTPSHLHSIPHYNQSCVDHAKLYGDHVMFLRDEVTKITGYYWYGNGFPTQNCADTNGYVDVRTGKKYTLHGEGSFFKDIGR
jgi:hypothetical protein